PRVHRALSSFPTRRSSDLQLKYTQNEWQPAPQAMRNLMVEARKAGLDVLLKTEAVTPTDKDVLNYRFLYLHGRHSFSEKKADLKDRKSTRLNSSHQIISYA